MSHQQPKLRAAPEEGSKCVINPVTTNPEEAAKFVQTVFKHEKKNVSIVAAELAPLWGFGPGSNHDPLARSRAECIFVSPEAARPRGEFVKQFVRGRWSLPLAKFAPTLALVKKYQYKMDWRAPEYPVPDGTPEEHYARFIIVMMYRLEDPYPRTSMLQWLRDARYLREDTWVEDVSWIYFHAVMYLQLKAMEVAKKCASPTERVLHVVNKLAIFFANLMSDATFSK